MINNKSRINNKEVIFKQNNNNNTTNKKVSHLLYLFHNKKSL